MSYAIAGALLIIASLYFGVQWLMDLGIILLTLPIIVVIFFILIFIAVVIYEKLRS